MDGLIKKPAWHKGGWTGWGGGEEGGWVHRKALKPWGDRCRRGGGEGEDRWVEGWRKGARLKERGASRVYTGQVFRFHGIIKGSRATWNSISPSSSAVVDDGTSWDVPRMCFFFFLFLFLFARRVSLGYFGIAVESGFFWDCRACWEGEIRESGVCGLFYFETTFPENVKFFRLFLISIHSSCWVNFEDFQF